MKNRTLKIGIYLSILHFVVGTVFIVFIIRKLLAKELGIELGEIAVGDFLDSILSPVIRVMWQPGLYLYFWSRSLVLDLPHIFSWVFMVLTSAIWGFGIVLIIAPIKRYGKGLLTSRSRSTR